MLWRQFAVRKPLKQDYTILKDVHLLSTAFNLFVCLFLVLFSLISLLANKQVNLSANSAWVSYLLAASHSIEISWPTLKQKLVVQFLTQPRECSFQQLRFTSVRHASSTALKVANSAHLLALMTSWTVWSQVGVTNRPPLCCYCRACGSFTSRFSAASSSLSRTGGESFLSAARSGWGAWYLWPRLCSPRISCRCKGSAEGDSPDSQTAALTRLSLGTWEERCCHILCF